MYDVRSWCRGLTCDEKPQTYGFKFLLDSLSLGNSGEGPTQKGGHVELAYQGKLSTIFLGCT